MDKEKIKKIIRSLLLSAKHGLSVSELCTEYHTVDFKPLPYKELGYSSAIEMVKDMPDVVKPVFYPGGVMILRGVADESTEHILHMVKQQKSSGRNSNLLTQQQAQARKPPPKPIIPNSIRVKLKALLTSYPNGIQAAYVPKAFERRFGHDLNHQKFGYGNLKGFLAQLSDITILKEERGSLYVYPSSSKDPTSPRDNKSEPGRRHKALPPSMSGSSIWKETQSNPKKSKVEENQRVIHDAFKAKTGISEKLKDEISQLFSKRPNGIWAARLTFEYKAFHKKPLDIQAVGFTSVVEMMSTLSDIVHIERPVPNGDWLLHAIGKSETKLMSEAKVSEASMQESDYMEDNVPRDVALEDACIKTQIIALEKGMIVVYISHLISPSHFYIQCEDETSKLDALMNDMKIFYGSLQSQNYLLTYTYFQVGQLCCAMYAEDHEWYRAEILEIISKSEALVIYIDYGNTGRVKISSLRFLKKTFVSLPGQAIKARLANVFSANEGNWPKESVRRFFELANDRPLYASVTEKDPDTEIVTVELIDTTQSFDVYINSILVKEGHGLKMAIPKEEKEAEAHKAVLTSTPTPSIPLATKTEATTAEIKTSPSASIPISSITNISESIVKVSTRPSTDKNQAPPGLCKASIGPSSAILPTPVINVAPNSPNTFYQQMPGLQQYVTVPNHPTSLINPPRFVTVPGLSYPVVYNQQMMQQVNAYQQPHTGLFQQLQYLNARPSMNIYSGSNMQYYPQCTQPVQPTTLIQNRQHLQPTAMKQSRQPVQANQMTTNTETSKCDSQVSKPPGFSAPTSDLLLPNAKFSSSQETLVETTREIAVVTPEKPSSNHSMSIQVASKPSNGEQRNLPRQDCNPNIIVAEERPSIQPASPNMMEFERKVLIKRLKLSSENTMHVVMYDDKPFVISAEISALLWKEDVLRQMLRQKKLNVTKETIAKEDEEELFEGMLREEVKGVMVNGQMKSCVTLYAFDSVPTILNIFKYNKSEDLVQQINNEINLWRASPEKYWEEEEDAVDQELTDSETLEMELEELRLMLQALQFRRKRIYLSMMTNSAAPTAVNDAKKAEEEIEEMRQKIKEKEGMSNKAFLSRS